MHRLSVQQQAADRHDEKAAENNQTAVGAHSRQISGNETLNLFDRS